MQLKGKTVLITGGAKRIGRVIASFFAEAGASVLIHYHNSHAEAEALAKELLKSSISARIYQADLLKVSEIQSMADRILKDVGGIDILVHNASLFYRTPFSKICEKDWDEFFAIHIKAPFFLAQALAPSMKERGGGRIIHIADESAQSPYRDYLPYCISKAAMMKLTEGLAKTLAPEILVTTVCPGPVLPPDYFTDEERKKIARKTVVGRWGSPEDIARMAVFLAGQDFVTGSHHMVDGGESLRSWPEITWTW